jgi:hypothetical protein
MADVYRHAAHPVALLLTHAFMLAVLALVLWMNLRMRRRARSCTSTAPGLGIACELRQGHAGWHRASIGRTPLNWPNYKSCLAPSSDGRACILPVEHNGVHQSSFQRFEARRFGADGAA